MKDKRDKLNHEDNQPIEPDSDFWESDEEEFIPCLECDGHPACADFGCAIDLGLGRMVKKNNTWDF
ncbi:MAG TPA: hypothetical protein VGZ90_13610 [Puia sp.]|jgi:hypothetical protein|nr:hypothetical protein [Puia sp.]